MSCCRDKLNRLSDNAGTEARAIAEDARVGETSCEPSIVERVATNLEGNNSAIGVARGLTRSATAEEDAEPRLLPFSRIAFISSWDDPEPRLLSFRVACISTWDDDTSESRVLSFSRRICSMSSRERWAL